MRFAHMADVHIGSWRDPKMKRLSTLAFVKAVDICIKEKVDFVLIAGDLFNTSMPAIDGLKEVTKKLKELSDNGIRVYAIAGSHDYSPSGKTMIDVLEEAGLLVNVAKGESKDNRLRLKFTTDKSGAKITGIPGRKGMLDRSYFEALDREALDREQGFKIFMFHTALTELKPAELKSMDSSPISLLPKGFDYYAAGHVHAILDKDERGLGRIVFPGPLFPANFKELEEFGRGGFYIVEYDKELKAGFCPSQVKNVFSVKVLCDHKTPEEIELKVREKLKNREFFNTIVTIRLEGRLESGKPSDINLRDIFEELTGKGAYFVMKSAYGLASHEFEEVKSEGVSVEEIEEAIIKDNIGQVKVPFDEEQMVKALIAVLNVEKDEGERVAEFEEKIKQAAIRRLEL